TPKSETSRIFRDAVLDLAENHDFARPFVNSGRLSVPCTYDGSPLNTPDALPGGPARSRPGSPAADLPLGEGFLLDRLGARGAPRFQILSIDADAPATFGAHGLDCEVIALSTTDNALLRDRYLGDAGSAIYLLRPDQHVAARWDSWDETAVAAALARAIGKEH
ncbi:MAG: FAD-dependent oxidoreductase, partial [Rhodobacteraceae bacterium]|nr:FAD-dependent oxidoreductase [Paracoccaceae bacterium]